MMEGYKLSQDLVRTCSLGIVQSILAGNWALNFWRKISTTFVYMFPIKNSKDNRYSLFSWDIVRNI